MHNSDLEHFYHKINNKLSLIKPFTGDEVLVKIIKSCRLKPYSVFDNTYQLKASFEEHWVDEFGNSLKFQHRIPHIILNDIELSENTKISTDLFFGNSIQKIKANSKFVLIVDGLLFNKPIHFIFFYGKDEYIRSFMFRTKWIRISPITMGIKALHIFFKNSMNTKIVDINKEQLDFAIPIDIKKCITIGIPIKQDLTSYLTDEILINSIILKGNKIDKR